MSALRLALLNSNLMYYILDTIASEMGVRGVMPLKQDSQEQVVAFFSGV